MVNPRTAKLADLIREVLAETLERRIKDPRLGFVTLTEVRLTGDNREATVFYTVLGDEDARAASAAALESAKGMLRSTVGKEIGIKFTPSLEFVLDATPESAQRIEEALRRAKEADAEVSARSQGATYAGGADPYRKPADEDADHEDEAPSRDE